MVSFTPIGLPEIFVHSTFHTMRAQTKINITSTTKIHVILIGERD